MKYTFLLALIYIVSACSVLEPKQPTDIDYRNLVLGTWAEYWDKDGNVKVYVTYFPDGRYHTYGYFPDDFKEYIFVDGWWNIKNGVSCITLGYESMGIFKKGEKICNRIVQLNKNVFVFDLDGENIEMKRLGNGKL